MIDIKEFKQVFVDILEEQSKEFATDFYFWPIDEYSLLEYHKNTVRNKKNYNKFLRKFIQNQFKLKYVLLFLFAEQVYEKTGRYEHSFDEIVNPDGEMYLNMYRFRYDILDDFLNLNNEEQRLIMGDIFYL